MNWIQYEPRPVEMQLCERRAQAAWARLAAVARHEPPRRRAGALLIAAGRALMARAREAVREAPATETCGCDI